MMFASPTPTDEAGASDNPNRRYLCVLYGECLTKAINWSGFTCAKCNVRVDVSNEVRLEDEHRCRDLLAMTYARKPDGSWLAKKTVEKCVRKVRGSGLSTGQKAFREPSKT